jgi:hypothetical protein
MIGNYLKIVFISWKVAYNFVGETTFYGFELKILEAIHIE